MDVRMSDEQQALRDAVVQLVGRLGPRSVQGLDDPERRGKLEAAVEGAGWRDLRTPDGSGGPLASGVEVAIVAEGLAHGLVDVPFAGPTLAGDLRRCGDAPSAHSVETVALTPDLAGLARVAADRVPSAVAVDARGCVSALMLDPDGRLVSVRVAASLPPVDLTRPSGSVERGDAPTERVGGGPVVGADLVRWNALGLAVACADLVGTMQGALDLAVDYAKSRRQFGVPVGSFQAVQHLLADALVVSEGSRSIARHAAWAVDALPPDEALTAAAAAKAYCSRSARAVCEAAIQVHGGIGNTWDCLAHVYLRRALLSVDLLGGVGPSLDRVTAGMLDGGSSKRAGSGLLRGGHGLR